NIFPENGIFARAMSKEEYLRIKNGIPSKRLEVWITAADDIQGVESKNLSKRLSLYKDKSGTILKETDDYVVVKFKIKDINSSGIYTPMPLDSEKNPRQFGWIFGGKTKGGAREWIMKSKDFFNRIEILE